MSARITVITDGSPSAAALAEWMRGKLGSIHVIQAPNLTDVPITVNAYESGGGVGRVVVLAERGGVGAEDPAPAALATTRIWLSDLGPFEQRIHGPDLIEAGVTRERTGYTGVLRLMTALTPGRASSLWRSKRRGRPKGSDPFRGVGFDVCVKLLLDPNAEWSERALADATAHSPYGVHRVLVELDGRGYLDRKRGATKAKDPVVLRDALAASWTDRMKEGRKVTSYVARDPDVTPGHVFERAHAHGDLILLAGASATTGATALRGGPLTVYAAGSLAKSLGTSGFEPAQRAVASLVVWAAPEDAVFFSPRDVRGFLATNFVISYLDLSTVRSERFAAAAEDVWVSAA